MKGKKINIFLRNEPCMWHSFIGSIRLGLFVFLQEKRFMRILTFLLLSMVFAASCQPTKSSPETTQKQEVKIDRQGLLASITAIENEFKRATKQAVDTEKAQDLISQTIQFAQSFPRDSMTPELVFRTAQVARAIKEYGRAIQMFGKVHREFPENKRAPTALFLQAYIFENELGDKKEAKKYYGYFMDKYPDNQMASQVEQILKVIDKSPEELVREFKEKNKK